MLGLLPLPRGEHQVNSAPRCSAHAAGMGDLVLVGG
ncbi:hypothetical protein SAMN05216557_1059 [Sphingomonas carotinifaciens]|uniref:Uncharacterized protein n=1 Tax=Sphingomonas carotinifaciens TaxID=1166323 RepID=A0A1G7N3K1_9SPHN|nr:hypothetical protein [Sphingomonas carotinifaciens]SDF67900.1 hypothetical protein SAMN05216557_1059 [Sphingomonas carotinifaciens]